ncbi:hypothetical protein [Methanosaeta sp. UBA356]|jgi:hypothetical protein|uniref:hypothetical protein n=1 Tax=Methanosaeta sp. UBA356 TaxID=1915559 RepID=UPI00257AEA3D|nr:hypothetical protein [Methanosaeta sp. UBA356]
MSQLWQKARARLRQGRQGSKGHWRRTREVALAAGTGQANRAQASEHQRLAIMDDN